MSEVVAMPHSKYTGEEIELGLRALAAFSGNCKRASDALKDQGFNISGPALARWRKAQQQRYAEIWHEVAPYLQARVAERQEELVEAYTDLEWEMLAKLREELPKIEGDRAAGALRNVAVTKSIAFDKGRLARDMPTEIRQEKASISDLLKLLASPKFRGIVDVNPELIEATAEEVT